LGARGIVCSMSRRGNCHDNAVLESVFSTVTSELADRFGSYAEAKMEVFDYLEVYYNQRRRHSTLGQISPAEFERRAARKHRERRLRHRLSTGVPAASLRLPKTLFVTLTGTPGRMSQRRVEPRHRHAVCHAKDDG
jgi:hypothetical protein